MHSPMALLSTVLVFSASSAVPDERTAACMGRLKHWWNEILGSFYDGIKPLGWWHTANGVEVLANYGIATKDTKFLVEVADRRWHSEPDQLIRNDYSYDDQGWMSHSWIRAHELTGEKRFLELAITWWSNVLSQAWSDAPCGGGLWWAGHPLRYKNAITNALFVRTSAKLFSITQNTTYLIWAERTWAWYEASGMITSANRVVDGLSDRCTPQGDIYTYNQGAIVGALAALYEAGGKTNSTLIQKALQIVRATTQSEDILADIGETSGLCKTDCWQFKGVFMRHLFYFHQAQPLPADVVKWIQTQADSIWKNAQDTKTTSFGMIWKGPFDKADPIRQMSALDAFVAADGTRAVRESVLV